MQNIIINPEDMPFLPTRRSPPKRWKLDSLEKVFSAGRVDVLPEVIIFETNMGTFVADGNHRILLAMKHRMSIKGIQLSKGEEFVLKGNPTLNYGKHLTYPYQNYGAYLAYITYCRIVALARGYHDFQTFYDLNMSQKEKQIVAS